MDKKAVSHVISGLFVLLILFLCIISIYAYSVTQDRYNQVVNERHQQDWERINEKVTIPSIDVVDDGSLNASLNNLGAVPARLVTLWLSAYNGSNAPQWQQQYKIDVWLSPGETKYNFGQSEYTYTRIYLGLPSEVVNSIKLFNIDKNWWYSMKLVTERGNVALYSPIPDIFEQTGGGGSANIPIVLYPSLDNFQYMDNTTAPVEFVSAFFKPETKFDYWHPLYRILVNNTTTSDIILLNNCTMVQIATAGGQVRVRYIVSNTSDISNDFPTPFVTQTLPAKTLSYVYFAADDISTPEWIDDPAHGWYTVGFLLWFRYEGDDEARNISLPPLLELLEIYN